MDDNLPLVSIFIISYNAKEFLREAIESCITQTYKNIEICVSDDCSTDGTHELLIEYKQLLKDKIKYNINSENLGVTKNSNKCLKLCSGKYIAYCGGDDLFLPEKIASQVDIMEQDNDAVVCFTDVDVFDTITNRTLYQWSKKYKINKYSSFTDVIRKGSFFSACSLFVRNSPDLGFDERLTVASDWFQIVNLLSNGGKLVYIDKILSRHRRSDKNVTNQNILKTVSRAENDTLMGYILLMNKYPEHIISIQIGLSRVYRSFGKYKNNKFYKVSFIICPWYWKNIVMYILSILKKS